MAYLTAIFALFVSSVTVGAANLLSMPPNSYMDTVLRTSLLYEAQVSQLDPLPLYDFKTFFEDHLPLVGAVKGSVNYTNGYLHGLSKVHRNDNCSGPTFVFNAAIFNCTIAIDNIKIEYSGNLKYGKLPNVPIKAEANIGPTVLFVDIVSYPQNPAPLLRFYRYLQVGTVETKFSGLGKFNKHLKKLDDAFRSRAWSMYFNALGQQFQYAFSRAVASVSWY